MIALILIDWADRDPNVSTVTWELFLSKLIAFHIDLLFQCFLFRQLQTSE